MHLSNVLAHHQALVTIPDLGCRDHLNPEKLYARSCPHHEALVTVPDLGGINST